MKSSRCQLGLAMVLGAALALPGVVKAAAGDSGSDSSSSFSNQRSAQNAKYDRAYKAAMNARYKRAIKMLHEVVAAEPRHADAHNMLGYSYRKEGQYSKSFRHYKTALTLDPEHRGAHEYIGQAYLEQKNLEKAKYHLDRLDDICTWGCEEYDTLKQAVESYKTGGTPAGYSLEEENGGGA
ncbi:MAG: tetratricopeptide repeat protein [Pseudomonadota bacterium]